MGFQKEQDAMAMRRALAQRLEHFGLKLHSQKTRVIEFGRFARERRAGRGLAKPRANSARPSASCGETGEGRRTLKPSAVAQPRKKVHPGLLWARATLQRSN